MARKKRKIDSYTWATVICLGIGLVCAVFAIAAILEKNDDLKRKVDESYRLLTATNGLHDLKTESLWIWKRNTSLELRVILLEGQVKAYDKAIHRYRNSCVHHFHENTKKLHYCCWCGLIEEMTYISTYSDNKEYPGHGPFFPIDP